MSAGEDRMMRWRRLGAPGIGALAVAVVMVAVVTVARQSGPGSVPRLPGLHEPDFGRDAAGALAPLRPEFAASRLGSAAVDRILASAGTAAPAAKPAATTQSRRPARPPSSSTPAPANHGLLSGVFGPGVSDLQL